MPTNKHDADFACAYFLGRMEEPLRSTLLHTFAKFSPSAAVQAWEQMAYRTALEMAGWEMEPRTIMVEDENGEFHERFAGCTLRHSPERQKEWAAKLNLMHPTAAFVASLRLAS